jgi:hypothetical protein
LTNLVLPTTSWRIIRLQESRISAATDALPPGDVAELQVLTAHTRKRLLLSFRPIEIRAGADEIFERALIDLLVLTNIDSAPHIAFEAGIEQA